MEDKREKVFSDLHGESHVSSMWVLSVFLVRISFYGSVLLLMFDFLLVMPFFHFFLTESPSTDETSWFFFQLPIEESLILVQSIRNNGIQNIFFFFATQVNFPTASRASITLSNKTRYLPEVKSGIMVKSTCSSWPSLGYSIILSCNNSQMGDWTVFANKKVRILLQKKTTCIGRFRSVAESVSMMKDISIRDKWMFSWEKHMRLRLRWISKHSGLKK